MIHKNSKRMNLFFFLVAMCFNWVALALKPFGEIVREVISKGGKKLARVPSNSVLMTTMTEISNSILSPFKPSTDLLQKVKEIKRMGDQNLTSFPRSQHRSDDVVGFFDIDPLDAAISNEEDRRRKPHSNHNVVNRVLKNRLR